MRLLHVLAERGFSGGEVQLEHLLRHLKAAGHDNHLLLVPGAEFARVGAELELPTASADLRRPWTPGAVVRVRRELARVRPQVLHFGCGRSLLWGGLFSVGVPVPLRVTTRRIDYPIGRSLYRGGRYRRLVDHVVANCLSVRRQVLDAGVPEDRVTVVHEGIDPAPFAGAAGDRLRARVRLGLPPDARVVTCAATLRPRKGQRLLIDAFARLAGRFPDSRLVLAGGGPDQDALGRRVADLGLGPRILLPGPIAPVRELYAASDLFVMPSYHEGLSNACLEASAAGLPLVVTAVGGLPEIVDDGVTGAVVPPGDAVALADRIAAYLADEELRRRAGEAGRERTTREFTARRMAESMESLFLELLDRRQRVPV